MGFAGDVYWSSTEYVGSNAWVQNFDVGAQVYYGKNYAGNVRAVRSF